MQHLTLDGFGGHRSRFDDIRLIHELVDELPDRLGLTTAMPPMLLPYYNGPWPDDCGISAFVFLPGGHLTLHTFSYRECYFADLLSPLAFDEREAVRLFGLGLPAREQTVITTERGDTRLGPTIDAEEDFGPHLFIDIGGYAGPRDMDGLFALFDTLPARIDMTPIMRPYVLRSRLADGSGVLSAVTMIAESHIALHIYEATGRAFFDIFSCRFFAPDAVIAELKRALPGAEHHIQLAARGHRYRSQRTTRTREHARSRRWLPAG